MGISACICFEAIGPIDPWMFSADVATVTASDSYSRPDGATHSVVLGYGSYYGIGCERGPWPTICGVLMTLHADPSVGRVWYFMDISDAVDPPPCSPEDVLAISRHYMQHGTRPHTDRLT